MASVISINTEVATTIYTTSKATIEELRERLASLDKDIMDLPGGGEWKGDAADKFMGIYHEMQSKITTEFPQLLDDLNENLDKNLQNLISADSAGA
jgi:WXG100 family type VII secretion target